MPETGGARSHRRKGIFTYILLNSLALAGVVFVVLTCIWISQGITFLAANRVRDISMQVVLKPEVSEPEAEEFVRALHSEHPQLELEFIGRAESQAMLSVQEPWMRNIGDVAIGQLPNLVIIRPPKGGNPLQLSALEESLKQWPRVDFIIFNTTHLDELIRGRNAVERYTSLFAQAVITAIVLVFLICNWVLSMRKPVQMPGRALLIGTINAVLAFGIALAAFSILRRAGVGVYPLPPLRVSQLGVMAGLVFIGCLFLELKDVRLKRNL